TVKVPGSFVAASGVVKSPLHFPVEAALVCSECVVSGFWKLRVMVLPAVAVPQTGTGRPCWRTIEFVKYGATVNGARADPAGVDSRVSTPTRTTAKILLFIFPYLRFAVLLRFHIQERVCNLKS